MTPDHAATLHRRHPGLFIRPPGDHAEPAACYFECGDGWFDLIDRTATQIDVWSQTYGQRIYIFHAKEKFSALRLRWRSDTAIWTTDASEALSGILDHAEQESRDICPRCGPK